MITAMTTYFYHSIRLLSSLVLLFLLNSHYPVFGQFVELVEQTSQIYFQEVVNDSPEQEAFIGYANRIETLSKEGFEEFAIVADKKENAILDFAVSGRFGYLNIRADESIALGKMKKSISKAFDALGEMEGLILDFRYNSIDGATQQELFRFIYEKKFTGPGVLLSSNSFQIPSNWHIFRPWQMLPSQIEELVTTELNYVEWSPNHSKIRDQVIRAALRKLRESNLLKDFGVI
jgi:hypothetical protein